MRVKRLHMRITGEVTGVGYRAWMKTEAEKLGVTGWVRNVTNGSVEARCEGEERALKEMIAACRKGPDVCFVKNISLTWEEGEKIYGEFWIHR